MSVEPGLVQTNAVAPTMKAARTSQVQEKSSGLEFTRVYTKPGLDPLDAVQYAERDSVITNPDGSVVF